MNPRDEIAALKYEIRSLRDQVRFTQQTHTGRQRPVRLVEFVSDEVGDARDFKFVTENLDTYSEQLGAARKIEDPYAIAFESGGEWFYCPCGTTETSTPSATCVHCTDEETPGTIDITLSLTNKTWPNGRDAGVDWAAALSATHTFANTTGCGYGLTVDAGVTTIPLLLVDGSPFVNAGNEARVVLTFAWKYGKVDLINPFPDEGVHGELVIDLQVQKNDGGWYQMPSGFGVYWTDILGDPQIDCFLQYDFDEALKEHLRLSFGGGNNRIEASPAPPPPLACTFATLSALETAVAGSTDYLWTDRLLVHSDVTEINNGIYAPLAYSNEPPPFKWIRIGNAATDVGTAAVGETLEVL